MASTGDNDNHDSDEQKAYAGGKVDMFRSDYEQNGYGMRNTQSKHRLLHAEYFAMSDNFFDTEFGTTVMGHLNLVSRQTRQTNIASINGKVANGSVIANVEAG